MDKRFTAGLSFNGIACIKDTTRPDRHGRPTVVALFFRDAGNDKAAEAIARLCARVMNEEAARRAAAEAHKQAGLPL